MRDEFQGIFGGDPGWPLGDKKRLCTYTPDGVRTYTLPSELGRITGLSIKNGRIVAATSSGVDFILPNIKIEGVQNEDGGKK